MTFNSNKLLLPFIFISILPHYYGEVVKKNYTGYSVWKAIANDEKGLQYLHYLSVDSGSLFHIDFWEPPRKIGVSCELMIDGNSMEPFFKQCKLLNIKLSRTVDNVQKLVDEEISQKNSRLTLEARDDEHYFQFGNHYPNLDEVEQYVKNLPSKYPGLVELESLTATVENRQIYIVKITNLANKNQKPALWIDAGIHAREWIAPVTALYTIDFLLNAYQSDPNIKKYLDNLLWYIVPVLNPDGYAYSHTIDRLWRKNRRLVNNCTDRYMDNCRGVDLNRNFGYHWGEIGSSADPKTQFYSGPYSFSEAESKGVRDFITAKQSSIKAYLTLHSSGQWWMYPYGYDYNTYSDDKDELAKLAVKATDALRGVHGIRYKSGSPPDVLYAASGISADWAKGVANIKYVYSIEMRPWDSSFFLPANQIIPTGEETWAAFKVIAEEILSNFN